MLADRATPPARPISAMYARSWLIASPPFRPASRASAASNSCPFPDACAARPPADAILRRFSGSMVAKPRLAAPFAFVRLELMSNPFRGVKRVERRESSESYATTLFARAQGESTGAIECDEGAKSQVIASGSTFAIRSTAVQAPIVPHFTDAFLVRPAKPPRSSAAPND